MYTSTNYRTKKSLKEAVANGNTVTVFQPGPFPGKTDGNVALEGPHYPEAHRWYASAQVARGVIIPGTVK